MSVQVSAKYTKDTVVYNGLDAVEKNLIEEGLNGEVRTRYAVVKFEVTDLNIDVKSGKRQPRVNFSAIEVMHGENESTVKAMLGAEFRYRNGRMDEPGGTLFDDPEPAAIEAGPETPQTAAQPGESWPGDADYREPENAAQDAAQPDSGTADDDAAGDGGEDAPKAAKRGSRAKATAAAE